MHKSTLKAAAAKFAGAKTKEEITGDYTADEIDEIFEAIQQPAKTGRNAGLSIPKITGRKIEGEDFKAYVELVRALDQRTLYDWTEYKAVGIFNKYEDQQSGEIVEGNILVGIELVDTTPLKHTAVEARHIETWATTNKGKKVMGGLNAQIYAKDNNRANSRYYLLKAE